MTIDVSRRRLIVRAGLAVAVLPFAARWVGQVQAAPLAKLPLDNPQARALAYTEDATTSKHPNYKAGSTCANCQFFTAATSACSLFPGFQVDSCGWCSAWSKRSG